MKHLIIFESYSKEKLITLESRQGKTIQITTIQGRIQSIENNAMIRFPFAIGQSYTRSIETWACTNGFTIDGKSACPEEKIFGIRKKDIPAGHELRMLFPSKFRNS